MPIKIAIPTESIPFKIWVGGDRYEIGLQTVPNNLLDGHDHLTSHGHKLFAMPVTPSEPGAFIPISLSQWGNKVKAREEIQAGFEALDPCELRPGPARDIISTLLQNGAAVRV